MDKEKLLKVLFNSKKFWCCIVVFLILIIIILTILLLNSNKKNNIDKENIQDLKNQSIKTEKIENNETQNNIVKEKESTLEENINDQTVSNKKTQNNEKNTTKIIEETVSIPFSKSNEEEANMLKGSTKIVISGVDGLKTVKYKVTYNSNREEISREIISETITKQPINEVIKLGTSDYNLNTDTYSIRNGYICNSNELDSLEECGYSGRMYCAIILNNTMYLTNVVTGNINCFNGLNDSGKVSSNIKMSPGNPVGTVSYNGQNLYYDVRAGQDNIPLTQEVCNNYSLACGRW